MTQPAAKRLVTEASLAAKKNAVNGIAGIDADGDITTVGGAKATGLSGLNLALTGVPTAPTAVAGTNSTQVANTAFVRANVLQVAQIQPGGLHTAQWDGVATPNRGTNRTDIVVLWFSTALPPVVTTGTAGAYAKDLLFRVFT